MGSNLPPPLSHTVRRIYMTSSEDCPWYYLLYLDFISVIMLRENGGAHVACCVLEPAVPQECPWRHKFLLGAGIKPEGVADLWHHHKGVVRTVAHESSLFLCIANNLISYTVFLLLLGKDILVSLCKYDLTHYHNTLSQKLERAKIPHGDLWLLM